MAVTMAKGAAAAAAGLMVGQSLRGKLGCYTLTKQLHPFIWVARDKFDRDVIVKSGQNWQTSHEGDLLKRFQHRTPFIRPLVDETVDDADTDSIVLKHLDNDLGTVSSKKGLSRPEMKVVAKAVLEALKVLHGEGYVHSDIKPGNILVNYGGSSGNRFKEIQLADLGNSVHEKSKAAREADALGTSMFRSLEMSIGYPWNTSTDIWSFGATLISLFCGRGFHMFDPKVPKDHDYYLFNLMSTHHIHFGPWPKRFDQIFDEDTKAVLGLIKDIWTPDKVQPFMNMSENKICAADKEFIMRIMKIGPMERPTVEELLADAWFKESVTHTDLISDDHMAELESVAYA